MSTDHAGELKLFEEKRSSDGDHPSESVEGGDNVPPWVSEDSEDERMGRPREHKSSPKVGTKRRGNTCIPKSRVFRSEARQKTPAKRCSHSGCKESQGMKPAMSEHL